MQTRRTSRAANMAFLWWNYLVMMSNGLENK